MQRDLYSRLLDWKEKNDRKPLVLKGARQVGKTYIVNQFGKKEFDDCVIINCDKDERVAGIFSRGFRTDRIISDIEILSGRKIIPGKTLIFIDEIGEVPNALASLKYFCEDSPEYHIIVAGSLLGLAIHGGINYPVGKVDELTLYPLSFSEFVRAKESTACADKLVKDELSELESLGALYEQLLRQYYFTGGMPEVVQGYVNGKDISELRDMQKRILADYALDISKHAAGSILGRIHQVWNSIPQQLVKSNKKFIYGDIQ